MKLRFALMTVMLLLNAAFSFGQTKAKIEKANILRYEKKNGQEVQYVDGDVLFSHDGTLLYCDRAYFNLAENEIDAQGNIRIIQGDSITVTSGYLKYKGDIKLAILRENVILRDKRTTLTTPKLEFDRINNLAYYTQGGVILDGQNELESEKGSYNTKTKIFNFRDSVTVDNPKYQMESDTLRYNATTKTVAFLGPTLIHSDSIDIRSESGWFNTINNLAEFNLNPCIYYNTSIFCADTIFYDRNAEYAKALRQVSIVDTANKLSVFGERGDFYQDREQAIISDKPWASMQMSEMDTLFIKCDTFNVYNSVDSTVKTLLAYHDVKFFMNDLQGVCDSLSYTTADSNMRMFTQPILWSSNNQFTADYIVARIYDKKIQRLFLDQNAFIIGQESPNYYNQIQGKNMDCFFRDNGIYLVKVKGNGQAIYFPKDDKDEFIGMNLSICSDLNIYLKEKKIQRINFITSPKSVLHPVENINPKESKLEGFRWLIDKRPLSKLHLFQ